MTPTARDKKRYAILAEAEASVETLFEGEVIPRGLKSAEASCIEGDVNNRLMRDLVSSLSAVDISHEEAIVIGIAALLRASRLPQQAVLYAASAYSSQENSGRKNHRIFP